VIAAGFERWEEGRPGAQPQGRGVPGSEGRSMVLGDPVREDIFAQPDEEELDLGDDEFDVPSFLK
jgi:hypothetical protein